jgi:all-trans-nonaprenyl-diphosphate synthase
LKEEVATYVNKSYYKTAALMANAMRGVPLFFDSSSEQEIASFRVGQHFGIAFQLVDDILDYTSTP